LKSASAFNICSKLLNFRGWDFKEAESEIHPGFVQLYFNPATVKMLSNLKVSIMCVSLRGCWSAALVSYTSYSLDYEMYCFDKYYPLVLF